MRNSFLANWYLGLCTGILAQILSKLNKAIKINITQHSNVKSTILFHSELSMRLNKLPIDKLPKLTPLPPKFTAMHYFILFSYHIVDRLKIVPQHVGPP